MVTRSVEGLGPWVILCLFGCAVYAADHMDQVSATELQRGEHLAQLLCGACHVVSRNQEFPPFLKQPTPTFFDIAARPNITPQSLRAFLATTHWDQKTVPITMPNPSLTPDEVDALTRYILSLRGASAPVSPNAERP
jgi:hypothetical protein